MATDLELKNTNKQWLALWFECSSVIAGLVSFVSFEFQNSFTTP
jgi:hypothetical protein